MRRPSRASSVLATWPVKPRLVRYARSVSSRRLGSADRAVAAGATVRAGSISEQPPNATLASARVRNGRRDMSGSAAGHARVGFREEPLGVVAPHPRVEGIHAELVLALERGAEELR